MKCKREGCPNMFKGGGYVADVFDERLTIKEKTVGNKRGEVRSIPNKRYIPDYKGHTQRWCEPCYREYEGYKYVLVYWLDEMDLKFKRRLKSKEQVKDAPELYSFAKNAPIVDAPVDAPKPTAKKKKTKVSE